MKNVTGKIISPIFISHKGAGKPGAAPLRDFWGNAFFSECLKQGHNWKQINPTAIFFRPDVRKKIILCMIS